MLECGILDYNCSCCLASGECISMKACQWQLVTDITCLNEDLKNAEKN